MACGCGGLCGCGGGTKVTLDTTQVLELTARPSTAALQSRIVALETAVLALASSRIEEYAPFIERDSLTLEPLS